jgi:hypothetical protein
MSSQQHYEPYDSYQVGDDVWCLGWLGMPFKVVGKDDESRTIQIDGVGPCSLPEGARIDLAPENHYMLTHEMWDSIWYWPDQAGERYRDVAERFVGEHHDGEIVRAYPAGALTVTENDAVGISLRVIVSSYWTSATIRAQPVAAIESNGSTLILLYDPDIPDDRWIPTGPRLPLEIRMVGYRWALTFGKMVLNWRDFD